MIGSFFNRLYVRIWLAVVLAVALVTFLLGWLVRSNMEQLPAPREVIIRDDAGQIIGQSMSRPLRVPGQGVEYQVELNDGRSISVHMPPRPRSTGEPPPARPWVRGPLGFLWILFIVGLSVALGSYPVIRRLTKRLEGLQRGVERFGEGDLKARVDAKGRDEVAFLAARFNHAADRIEGLVQAHKSLLANASHELRSPLTRIRMGLEFLGDGPSGSANDKAKAEITRNIAELDQLIDEILLASRLDNAQSVDIGTVENVDLIALAAEECARLQRPGDAAKTDASTLSNASPESEHAAAELHTQVTNLQVPGVAKLLRRLVRNLLENAARYGGQGQISLHLARIEKPASATQTKPTYWAEIRVCDHGPGVPASERQRIFEPFYRLQSASERAGGVGLGLALVQSIAQRHGGSVRCEDNLGTHNSARGACFVVELPIQN
jgi:two-component system, OmpR family, sensor kinase